MCEGAPAAETRLSSLSETRLSSLGVAGRWAAFALEAAEAARVLKQSAAVATDGEMLRGRGQGDCGGSVAAAGVIMAF